MAYPTVQRTSAGLWRLAERQHGAVEHEQLIRLGYSSSAIKHRIAAGRLHPAARGVYAVGRPELSQQGRWTAAVLSCGPNSVLSHGSAAALWGIAAVPARIDVSVPSGRWRKRSGITVHRRTNLGNDDRTTHCRVPVTTAACTLIDLAATLTQGPLERAINEADKLGLIDHERLREALERSPRRLGIAVLRRTLDRHSFVLTDSELERRFLEVVRRTGVPIPETGRWLHGFKVDFFWPDLDLVVETDGLRYHRTAAQQTRDRARDQAHTSAGLTCLRFTHAQVRYEPEHVRRTLAAVIRRLPQPDFCVTG